MNDDELEVAILKKYIAQHKLVGESNSNKCARELDMREVLKEIIGNDNQDLEYNAGLWLNRLAPRSSGKSKGVLRPCSNSTLLNSAHKFHARAYTDVINNQPSPAWDRIRELEEKLLTTKNEEISRNSDTDKSKGIFQLNPSFYGIGINLKEACKGLFRWLENKT